MQSWGAQISYAATNIAFLVKACRRKKIAMDKHLLAQQLRQRQYAHGHLPRHLIDTVSDEDMLDSYITCSCCGEKQVTSRQLEMAVAQARDAYHFLLLCDEQARAAPRGHIQLPPPGPNRPARRTHRRRRCRCRSRPLRQGGRPFQEDSRQPGPHDVKTSPEYNQRSYLYYS